MLSVVGGVYKEIRTVIRNLYLLCKLLLFSTSPKSYSISCQKRKPAPVNLENQKHLSILTEKLIEVTQIEEYMEIPKDITGYLTSGEKIEKVFKLKNCQVFASNKRLYRKEGRNVKDAAYEHISSLDFRPKRHFWLIAVGIFLMFLAFRSGFVLFFFIAIILIVLGIFLKSERLYATLIGESEKLDFKGSRSNLDSLFKIVRERKEISHREAPLEKPLKSVVEEKQPIADVFDQIEKMSKLKDRGILTQEEFDKKKKELLSRF